MTSTKVAPIISITQTLCTFIEGASQEEIDSLIDDNILLIKLIFTTRVERTDIPE